MTPVHLLVGVVVVIVIVFFGFWSLVRQGLAPTRVRVAISFLPPKLDISIERGPE